MSTHKHIDRVCAAVLALTLILTALFIQGKSLGLEAAPSAPPNLFFFPFWMPTFLWCSCSQ